METIFQCRICKMRYSHDELMRLRKETPMYGWRQFLPCTHEFSSLEQITVLCHQCKQVGEDPQMWADGYDPQGREWFLCQECHEKQVDADFWETVTTHPSIWQEPGF